MKRFSRKLLLALCTLGFVFVPEAMAQAPSQDPFASLPTSGYSLARKDAPGQIDYYKVTRRLLYLNDAGQVTRRVELVGHFQRLVTTKQVAGSYAERIIWGNVWVRDSEQTPPAIGERTLSFADKFAYEDNFQQSFDPASLDLSALPRTQDGLWFAWLIWDTHRFDRLLSQELGLRELTQLGARSFRPSTGTSLTLEFKPLLEKSSYSPGELQAQLSGLTRIDRVSCALVDFTVMGNAVELHERATAPADLRGTEHDWGQAAVSLTDGKIMYGKLTALLSLVPASGGAPLRRLEEIVLERIGP